MARRFNLPKPVAHYAQDPTAGLPGDQYYNTTDKVFKQFDGTTWVTQVPPESDYATTAGSATTATNADNIKTIQTATNTSFYPVFVDSNNTTAGYESVYTDAGLSYNPSFNSLTVGYINATVQYSDIVSYDSTIITSGVVTANTDWQINSQSYKDSYGIVQLTFVVERTGANITVGTNPTDGNITNTTVATIASGKRPVFEAIMVSGNSGPVATGYIASSGDVVITATIPGDSINTGNTFTFNSTYIKA